MSRSTEHGSLQDLNKEFDKWIPDYQTSDSVSGVCDAKSIYGEEAVAKLNDGSHAPPNQSYDYYVCGGKDEDERGQCIGLSDSTWHAVWENCKPDNNKENRDLCSNIPRQNQVFDNFNVGWQTNCNDDAKYVPETDSCSKDCGVDSKCKIPDGNYGGHTRPAYPVNIPLLESVSDGVGGSRRIETDKGQQFVCPSTHSRTFSCAGDGFPNPRDDVPGCGQGKDIDDLEDSINFCARPNSDYNFNRLAGCCLQNTPGYGDGSISEEQPKNTCPRGYCRSHLEFSGSSGNEAAADKCKQPFTLGGKMGCYAMSNNCNIMFKDICDQNAFLNAGTNAERKKQDACKRWAKIMPGQFNEIAKQVCKIPEIEGDDSETGTITDDQIVELNRAIIGRGGIQVQNQLVDLFTSEICRDYILNNINDNVALLRKICELAVEKRGENWIQTDFGEKMKDICPCWLPTEYYEWKKKKILTDEGRTESSVSAQTKPWCFDMDCTATMLFPDEYSQCPAIQTCINEIEQKVTVAGSGRGKMTMPTGREISAGSQACNFSAMNTPTTPTIGAGAPTTGGLGTIAAGAANQANLQQTTPGQQTQPGQYGPPGQQTQPGQYGPPGQYGQPNPYGAYGTYGAYGQSQGMGGSDNMIQGLALLFGVFLCILGVGLALFMSGKNNNPAPTNRP